MEREPHAGSGPRAGTERVVRDIVREERRAPDEEPAGGEDPAEDLATLRRSVRDLKHDVRMLKVGMDKQTLLLETVAGAVEDLRRELGRRR